MPQRCLEEIDSEIKEVHGRTFRKLGSLLIEIVDRKLFQLKGFTNVEDYFNSEPHLPSARQAFRLISATRFSRHLPHTLPQPKSERQVRPLLGRPIEEAKLLWAITTRIAAERKCAVDGKLVAKVVKEFQEGKLDSYVLRVEATLNGDPPCVREDCDGDSPTVENERGSPQVRGCERQVMKQERKGERTLGVPAAPARGVKSQGKGQSGFGGASGYVQPGGRSHSAPSQASSSENVCSCCHATSDCQVLSMAQQIARIVGVLAQAWGYSEETQRYAPVHQPCNPNQPMSINSVHKLGAAQVRSEELHSSTNFETQHKKNDHKEVSQRRDQCNDEHTSEVAMVLRKSHHQLMLMVQQMGMTIEPNTATPWNFWPQSWSAHPGPVADWRQWCNFTGAGAHTNKETMHVYSGNYGALVPSTIYRTTVQSPPVATGGAPSLYGMQTIPEVDAPGIPLFPTDGLQFAHTESNGRTTAKIPYSPEHNITLVEAKNMIHEAPVPHSLSLPLSGKKRGRSPEGIRGNRRGSARRRKMVRFTTPDKYCGMLEAKDDVDAQRDPSRRVDEIMVAEVLVCMSMSCF